MLDNAVSSSGYRYNPVVVVCAVIVLFFISQVVGALLAAPIVHLLTSNNNLQLFMYVAANFVVALALIATTRQVLKFSWQSIGVKTIRAKSLFMVIPAFVLYFIASALFTVLAAKLIPGFNADQAQEIGFSGAQRPLELTAVFISLAVLTPVLEELLFRGLLFRGLRKRFPFWPSALVTSLLFAVAHLQWNVALDTFTLSLLLCYLVEKADSIIPAVVLHALKNGLAFVLLFIVKTQ